MCARQKEKRPPRQLFSVRSIITGSVFLTHPNLAGRSNPGHLRLPLLIPPSKSTSPPRLVFHAVSNNFGSRTSLDPTHSPGVSHYHPTVQCVDLPHSQLALSRSDNAPLNATRLSAGRRNSTANCCRPIPRAHAPTRPSIPSSRGGKGSHLASRSTLLTRGSHPFPLFTFTLFLPTRRRPERETRVPFEFVLRSSNEAQSIPSRARNDLCKRRGRKTKFKQQHTPFPDTPEDTLICVVLGQSDRLLSRPRRRLF